MLESLAPKILPLYILYIMLNWPKNCSISKQEPYNMYIYSDEFSMSRKRFAGVNGGLYRAKTALETRNCFTSAFLLGFDKQYHPPLTANNCLQGNIYSALTIEQCASCLSQV